MYYYDCLKNEEYTYTCDMLRLKTYLSRFEVTYVKNYLISHCDTFFTSSGFGKFPLNWKIGSVWFGLGAKTDETSENRQIFCIEFNPNKCYEKDFLALKYFLFDFDFVVTRYDLAIDIPFNINQLYFSGLNKRSYSVFFNNFNDKTLYFGKGNGHTKIYNKSLESDLDYNLTRYEVTIEDEFDFLTGSPSLPSCQFVSMCRLPYYSFSNDDTLDCILYAVNNGFPYRDLSRRYKEKIRKDIIGMSEININLAVFSLQNCLRLLRSRFI